ncbi:MAG: hypothetical protein ACRDJ5_09480 [Actinomycetota bacterium]
MRGGGRLLRRIIQLIFVRMLFQTLGLWPTIVLLVAVAAGLWWHFNQRRR